MSRKQKQIILISFLVTVGALLFIWGFMMYRNNSTEEKAVVTSAVTETPAPTPAPTKNPHEGMVKSSMTGQWVKPEVEAKRPYAVMINNIEYAFNRQMGTSKADILYEALAEGGITRMLAVYQDISDVKKVGSVRSARHYYVQFAEEWDAIFCHFGHTKYAVKKMKKLKTENISGLSAIGPIVYARDNRIAAPHNVFTNGRKIKKGAKKLKYPLKKDESQQAEHFQFNDSFTELAKGKKAKNITLPFSAYSTCQLKYDAKKKVYKKYEYKKKHMDTYYKKQLTFKNVIVQLVEESNIDRNGYQTMKLENNSGKGYYLTGGKKVNITWEKNEKEKTMVYKAADGQILSINPGKTYIAVYPKNRKKLIKIK